MAPVYFSFDFVQLSRPAMTALPFEQFRTLLPNKRGHSP